MTERDTKNSMAEASELPLSTLTPEEIDERAKLEAERIMNDIRRLEGTDESAVVPGTEHRIEVSDTFSPEVRNDKFDEAMGAFNRPDIPVEERIDLQALSIVLHNLKLKEAMIVPLPPFPLVGLSAISGGDATAYSASSGNHPGFVYMKIDRPSGEGAREISGRVQYLPKPAFIKAAQAKMAAKT